ncbi:MAG: hypothetical protein J7L43_00455 [Candidatus Aenigmarchaeota archaeon]|nr:hypothetical protein [Candidatus Aenigmarchaeota archaeon]
MVKIKVATTEVTSYELITRTIYGMQVTDIFGREWCFSNDGPVSGESESFDLMNDLAIKIKNKGYFNPKLFWGSGDERELYGKRFDSIEEVNYVFSYSNEYGDYELTTFWNLHVITEGGLFYKHDKIFTDYDKLKEFALKVKNKGLVNLNYWICQGYYPYEGEASMEAIYEFEERYDSYEDPEERVMQEVRDMIEADRLPDGTVPGFRD